MTAPLPSLTPTRAELDDAKHQAAQQWAAAPASAAARTHLERAYVELSAAQSAWGCWADEVAQDEEKNVGLGIAAGGLAEGDSALYDAALALGSPYCCARGELADSLGRIHPPYVEARAAGRLLAAVSAHLAETTNGAGR